VRQQVIDADLPLGVWFQVPELAGDENMPASDRLTC
jgi:hypothetical protein